MNEFADLVWERVCMVMLRRVFLGWVVATLGGCLGFSTYPDPDEYLFQWGLPKLESIKLRVPGAEPTVTASSTSQQGLNAACSTVAERQGLACRTRDIALTFNNMAFLLLSGVDHLTAQPPSQKRQHVRIWGPHYDASKDQTMRFEMHLNDERTRFDYCMHVASGNKVGFRTDANVACGADADGFVEVFSGDFSPEDMNAASARVGVGGMVLNISKAALGRPAAERGVFRFTYDTRQEQQTLSVVVDDVVVEDGTQAKGTYAYHRDSSGEGNLVFVLTAVRCQAGRCAGNVLDRMELNAHWNTLGAARVSAHIDDDQVPAAYADGVECTNENQVLVYRHFNWAESADPPVNFGLESACPFSL